MSTRRVHQQLAPFIASSVVSAIRHLYSFPIDASSCLLTMAELLELNNNDVVSDSVPEDPAYHEAPVDDKPIGNFVIEDALVGNSTNGPVLDTSVVDVPITNGPEPIIVQEADLGNDDHAAAANDLASDAAAEHTNTQSTDVINAAYNGGRVDAGKADDDLVLEHILNPSRRSTLSILQGSVPNSPAESRSSMDLDMEPIVETWDSSNWKPGFVILVPVLVKANKDNEAAFALKHPGMNPLQDTFAQYAVAERPAIIVAVYEQRMTVLPILKQYPAFSYKHNEGFDEKKARSFYGMSLRIVLPDDDMPSAQGCKRLVLKTEGRWQPDTHYDGQVSYHVNLNQSITVDYDSEYEIVAEIDNIDLLSKRYKYVHGELAGVNIEQQQQHLRDFVKKNYNVCKFHKDHPNLTDHEVEVSEPEDSDATDKEAEIEVPGTAEDSPEEPENKDKGKKQGTVRKFEAFVPPGGLELTSDKKHKTWKLSNGQWKCGHYDGRCKERPPGCVAHLCCVEGSKSKPAKAVTVNKYGEIVPPGTKVEGPDPEEPPASAAEKQKIGKKRKASKQEIAEDEGSNDDTGEPAEKPKKKRKKDTTDEIEGVDTAKKTKKHNAKKDKKAKPAADAAKKDKVNDHDEEDNDAPPPAASESKVRKSTSKSSTKEPKRSGSRKGSTADQSKSKSSETKAVGQKSKAPSAVSSRKNFGAGPMSNPAVKQASRASSRITSREKAKTRCRCTEGC